MTDDRVTSDDRAPAASSRAWARGWIGDSSQLLASQVLTVAATSFAAIMIARTLDPDDWGVFSAFLGLSMALAFVADFGLGTWLLRELSAMFVGEPAANASVRAGRMVCSAVLVNTLVATPLIVAAVIWAGIAGPGAAVSFALVSLLLYGMLTASATALETYLRARRRVRLVLSASLLEKGALVVLLVAVVVGADGSLAAIGAAYLAAGASRVVFDGLVVFRHYGVPLTRPTPRGAVDVGRPSLPLAFNAASLHLVPRLDTLVLLTLSATSAAWFAIGERVLGPALLLPATFGHTLYPFMATQAARRAAPWKLAGTLGALGAVVAATGFLLAPMLIPLLFGDAYDDAVPVVQVMLLTVPIVYATSPLLVIAYSHGRERSFLVPFLLISLGGTAAIVVGEALGGASFAAAGYVARSASVLVVVAVVAYGAWRRQVPAETADDLNPRSAASVQI